MITDGRLSKVRRPSPPHAAGRIEPEKLRPPLSIELAGPDVAPQSS